MHDLYWKIFSQTGNVETYLLIKELETNQPETDEVDKEDESASSQT